MTWLSEKSYKCKYCCSKKIYFLAEYVVTSSLFLNIYVIMVNFTLKQQVLL